MPKRYFNYNEPQLKAGMSMVRNGVGIRKAARDTGIHRSTLSQYVKEGRSLTEPIVQRTGRKPYLHTQEEELVEKVYSTLIMV